jgi:hypothetical protein
MLAEVLQPGQSKWTGLLQINNMCQMCHSWKLRLENALFQVRNKAWRVSITVMMGCNGWRRLIKWPSINALRFFNSRGLREDCRVLVTATAMGFHIGYADMSLRRNPAASCCCCSTG